MFLLAVLLTQSLTSTTHAAAPAELFEYGEFSLYLPPDVPTVSGILLALGGPDTRAFASDGSFGAPSAELEASLHVLGQDLRTLAAELGLAILGTSRRGPTALPDQPGSDELIFNAIIQAASISGRRELAGVPIFVYGISDGTPQAAGFVARHPERVGAILLKVPAPPKRLDSAGALAVPTCLILAERETLADNRTVLAVFESNRRAGGLWAAAVQPGVPHHSLTPDQRALTVNWLRAVVKLRLGAPARDAIQAVPESAGWLGHEDYGVSDWAGYPGDRRAASWFPSRATAEEWWAFTRNTQAGQ